MDKAKTGSRGEVEASRYLREKGYRILAANYRCRLGEIDIIAENEKYICFTEVKTRAENSRFSAADAVDFSKRKKLIAAANLFLAQYDGVKQPRFDIVEVYIHGETIRKIRLIKNAYNGEGK